jgi:SAM-dependent methyltransferase
MGEQVRRIGVREGYDRWAASYDAKRNPVVALDARHSLRMLAPQRGELILEAGCGSGRNLPGLIEAGAMAVGIDFSEGMLHVAQARFPGQLLLIADIQTPLPFRNQAFDATYCALVGEHLVALAEAIRELWRVTKDGGRLVFSVYHPAMAGAGAEANFDVEGVEYRLGAELYGVQDYIDAIEAAGFRDVAYREFWADEELVERIPAAARYASAPMLLVITGRR